jgi:hypothetical protein
MTTQALSYIDSASSLVPSFGKIQASIFCIGLVLETLYRSSSLKTHLTKDHQPKKQEYSLSARDFSLLVGAKALQSSVVFRQPLVDRMGSYKTALCFSLDLLTHPWALSKLSQWTNLTPIPNTSNHSWQIEADRPPLVALIQAISEIVHIAAKVLGSLATGTIVQQMWNGKTDGKVKVVVSSILLLASAYNVYTPVTLTAVNFQKTQGKK